MEQYLHDPINSTVSRCRSVFSRTSSLIGNPPFLWLFLQPAAENRKRRSRRRDKNRHELYSGCRDADPETAPSVNRSFASPLCRANLP